MTHPDDTPDIEAPRPHRTRFELVFASVWLAIGLFALPAVIYTVGTMALGPYGENAGLGRFYGDFFRDLALPSIRAWTLVLGPLIIVSLIRLIFVGVHRKAPPVQAPPPPQVVKKPAAHARVEPRVTLD